MFSIENLKKDFKLKMLQALKEKFEALDQDIFKTRDKKRYVSVKVISRSILTDVGHINFRRHIYKYYNEEKQKWKYIALVDKELGIEKYAKIINSLKEKILSFIADGKRYRDILDAIPEANISTMTISRLFRKELKDMQYVKNKVNLLNGQNLYINTDDSFVNVVENGQIEKYRIRTVSFNTGISKIKTIYKYRNVLENKRITYLVSKQGESISQEEFVNFVWNKALSFYENVNEANLILGGDGAPWIRESAMLLGATYVLDKFHFIRQVNSVFLKRNRKKVNFICKNCYYRFQNALYDGDLNKMLNGLNHFKNEFKNTKGFKEKFDKANILEGYIKRNYKGIYSNKEKWNIGVSAESDVSHLVKSIKGYGAKIYNHLVYKNMLAAKANQINNRL